MAEIRECAQCGTKFSPGREHARFCSARCRMAWNRAHAGVAAAPAVAIDWSVSAMTEATSRLSAATGWDLPHLAVAVGETVWWVTLVDATLVRYHPEPYERALASDGVKRHKTEKSLAGLRYVRNQLGRGAEPATFIQPLASGDAGAGWTWRALPEPCLDGFTPTGQHWELNRYKAYQSRLAGHNIAGTFTRCAEFLADAAALALGDQPDPR